MLILALIISSILVIASIVRYRKVFNPFSLEVYFSIFFLILPQLLIFDTLSVKDNFFSDLVIIIYIVSIFIGTLLKVETVKIKGIENVAAINTLNLIIYGLIILPLMPMLLQAGISAEGIRSFYETVVFSKFASFFELSKFVLYFIIFFKLLRNEKFSIGFFFFFPLVFFYGSRFVILDAIIYLCVFLEQYKSVGIKKIIITSFIGVSLIGIYTYYQIADVNIRDYLVSYFDIYRNQTFIINKLLAGDVEYFHGRLYFSSYLKFIPRILWEDKPKEFGFAVLNYRFFPAEATAGYMPSFGLGAVFADFGFYSVIATGITNGFLRNFFYRTFLKTKNNLTFFLYIFPFSIMTNIFLIFYLCLDYVLRIIHQKRQAEETSHLR